MLRDPQMAALTGSTSALTGEASGSNGTIATFVTEGGNRTFAGSVANFLDFRRVR